MNKRNRKKYKKKLDVNLNLSCLLVLLVTISFYIIYVGLFDCGLCKHNQK